MVGVDVYFCGFRMQGIGFMQEVAEITLADDKRSPRDWFHPADSAALTPAPRLAESNLRHSLGGRGVFLILCDSIIFQTAGWGSKAFHSAIHNPKVRHRQD